MRFSFAIHVVYRKNTGKLPITLPFFAFRLTEVFWASYGLLRVGPFAAVAFGRREFSMETIVPPSSPGKTMDKSVAAFGKMQSPLSLHFSSLGHGRLSLFYRFLREPQ